MCSCLFCVEQICTLPEYISRRYGGKRLRMWLSVVSLLLYIFTKISVSLNFICTLSNGLPQALEVTSYSTRKGLQKILSHMLISVVTVLLSCHENGKWLINIYVIWMCTCLPSDRVQSYCLLSKISRSP